MAQAAAGIERYQEREGDIIAGTKAGGLKAAASNKARHGANYYAEIGKLGGKKGTTGGFASSVVGSDWMTGRDRATVAGRIGGRKSRRGTSNTVHPNVRPHTTHYACEKRTAEYGDQAVPCCCTMHKCKRKRETPETFAKDWRARLAALTKGVKR